MRTTRKLQLFLRPQKSDCRRSDELLEIDVILRKCPNIEKVYEQVLQDVSGGKKQTGAQGLSAEQIVKLGFLRIRYSSSYRYLEEQTEDSYAMRAFLNLGLGQKISRSTINNNLKKIGESTWKLLNDGILKHATKEGYEDGKKARGDYTGTETNIHYPTDASLLNDSVRVLTRTLNRLLMWTGVEFESCDHHKRAKKKLFLIHNCRKARKRQDAYLELIRVTRKTLSYAEKALPVVTKYQARAEEFLLVMRLESELKHDIPLVKRVIEQASRRIVNNEKVPAEEKLVSLFEPQTDIIAKGERDVLFGHKIFIATGKSSLILQIRTLDGNPADSTLVKSMVEEHKRVYQSAPEELVFDGCFGSAANRDHLKEGKRINFLQE